MKAILPFFDRIHLARVVFRAIRDAFNNPMSTEPQLVAKLVYELPNKINSITLSQGRKISAGGVFVHARPLVTCSTFPEKTPKSVEIGDLLLIYTLVTKGKIDERRALLLQAKMTDCIPATPDNRNQWHLYEKWPQFTYAARSGALNGSQRFICEPDMYDAAKYLLISRNLRLPCIDGFCHWQEICSHHTAQPTSPNISRYRCFIHELTDFFTGNGGKRFVFPQLGVNGWDQVVNDLIKETAKAQSVYTGRASGASPASPRGCGVLFLSGTESEYYALPGRGNRNLPPSDVPERWLDDPEEDGGGISTIEVVIEQDGNEGELEV